MSETFDAAAQYDDWTGTAAADNQIDASVQSLLRERGLQGDEESLVGLQLFMGNDTGFSLVTAYLVPAADAEAAKTYLEAHEVPNVKKVDVELSAAEFLALFKTFSLSLSWKGMELTGRTINVD